MNIFWWSILIPKCLFNLKDQRRWTPTTGQPRGASRGPLWGLVYVLKCFRWSFYKISFASSTHGVPYSRLMIFVALLAFTSVSGRGATRKTHPMRKMERIFYKITFVWGLTSWPVWPFKHLSLASLIFYLKVNLCLHLKRIRCSFLGSVTRTRASADEGLHEHQTRVCCGGMGWIVNVFKNTPVNSPPMFPSSPSGYWNGQK